jgi:N-acetylmuramoyl-L-alanine amidase-like protein
MPKRVVAGLSIVALLMSGVAALTNSDVPTAVAAHSDFGRVHARALAELPGSTPRKRLAGLAPSRTEPFSMVGVTWNRSRNKLQGSVKVRTRSAATQAWSAWRTLDAHPHDKADGPTTREGTPGLWVGPSNGVQVRVKSGTLPSGLRAELVDPGTTVQPMAAPRPFIIPRADWGANEKLVKEPPEYDTAVRAAFIHHTATGNRYTCAESAAVIRSVFLYHVRSNGWNDIGYNFLVDKCGTVFEGRAGGTARPVHGAHTLGFNTDTTGIALLGTHTATTPTHAALRGAGRTAAWKLGLTGVGPTGKVELTQEPSQLKKTFKKISGHRDGVATECPGERLYAKLGTIRTLAQRWTIDAVPPAARVVDATKVGQTHYVKDVIKLRRQSTTAPVESYQLLVNGSVRATVPASATSIQSALTPGTHNVALRAKNINGTTALSPGHKVVGDTTRPAFSPAVNVRLRHATVNSTGVPVTLGWKATDNTLLHSLKATAPVAKTFTPATTGWAAWSPPGGNRRWSLTARDASGNTATSSVTRTATLQSETAATRAGGWSTATTSGYLGGRSLTSRNPGATLRWAFTGRQAGIVVRRGTNVGAVHVVVDGARVATVDTRATTTAHRQLVWSKTWSGSARHTIRLVVVGTPGRPMVDIDGIAVLN